MGDCAADALVWPRLSVACVHDAPRLAKVQVNAYLIALFPYLLLSAYDDVMGVA